MLDQAECPADFSFVVDRNLFSLCPPCGTVPHFCFIVKLVQNILIPPVKGRSRQLSGKNRFDETKPDCVAILQLTVSEKPAINVCPIC